jgi:hypothetical protein
LTLRSWKSASCTAQRHSINHAVVQAKTNDATRKRKCCKPGGERV